MQADPSLPSAGQHARQETEPLDVHKTAETFSALATCFASLGLDIQENIQKLTACAGQLLEADCALYTRLEGERLCSVGRWMTPPEMPPIENPQGHIPFDVINQPNDDILLVRDLPNTPYAHSDPLVARCGLRTYIGHPVSMGDTHVGSLCAGFTEDVIPPDEGLQILRILARVIGMAELRRREIEEVATTKATTRILLDATEDMMILVDPQGTILDINRGGATLIGTPAEELIGTSVYHILTPEERADRRRRFEEVLRTGQPMRYENIRGSLIREMSIYPVEIAGTVRALAVCARDVSTLRQTIEERDQLILELQNAMAQVYQLQNLLPICSRCKRIRDDAGYWHQVEQYLLEHANIQFTHGICPECARELYPDFFGDDKPTA